MPWSETWAITVWLLWKWRNGEIFRGELIPLAMKMEMIQRSVVDTAFAWSVAMFEQIEFGPSSEEQQPTM